MMALKYAVLAVCWLLIFIGEQVMAAGYTPGEPYRFVDQQGRVFFTDKPPHDGYVKLVKTWKGWQLPVMSGDFARNKRRYQPLVHDISRCHKLQPELADAVVYVESFYNPDAISSAGAMGLMQLMPATAKRYGVHNRRDPQKNIEAGVLYLKDLMVMFDNDLELVLAAYNAGENAVKRYGNRVPPYQETREYVHRVKQRLSLAGGY
ncbi:transglycosylase-like protein with SLT domain [Alteromonadaceae bacterium 2753L.S.0a.02]|nr:transglycosylase-like protein with SLT domain [Alteromonadaceae bacterium 2753L.S.0a.02]